MNHKAWNWEHINDFSWGQPSPEFLPVALRWSGMFTNALDIGTGIGRHAIYLSELGLQVTAIDLSEGGISLLKEKCRTNHINMNAAVADMTALPFGNDSFDCVICFHTIYHTNLNGLQQAIDEIYRVLRTGGEAYLTFNSKNSEDFTPETSENGCTIYKNEGEEKNVPHTYVSFDQLQPMLKRFQIIRAQEIKELVIDRESTSGVHYYVHIAK